MIIHCERCKKEITTDFDLVKKYDADRNHVEHTYCKSCDELMKQELKEFYRGKAKKALINSFIWGTLVCAFGIVVTVMIFQDASADIVAKIMSLVCTLSLFTFVSCLILKNNCVVDIFLSIATFSFVKMPGLIIGLDIDSILFALLIKGVFLVLSIIVAILMTIIGFIVSAVVSLFVYPFALGKNIKGIDLEDYA